MVIASMKAGALRGQPRESDYNERFMKRPRAPRQVASSSTMESAFEDTKQYVLTGLGSQSAQGRTTMRANIFSQRWACIATVVLISFLLLVPAGSQQLPTSRNPKYNSSVNPKYNSSINPKYNSSINPKYNSSINPKYNSSINPKYNSSINPKYNSSVNPKYNNSINPKYNSSVNPKSNSSLNPKYAGDIKGKYYFNLDGEIKGILVYAGRGVLLEFDNDLEWNGYAVANDADGFNLFTLDGEWIGYFTANSAGDYNRFGTDGEWLGFTT
jgi:hypothetical protein